MSFFRKLFADKQPDFDQTLQGLRATLLDSDAVFSGSAMLESLVALQDRALQLGEHSPQRGWLAESISRLQSKRGDSESVLEHGRLALAIHQQRPFLDDEAFFYLHYRLATAAQDEQAFADSLAHLAVCLAHPQLASLDPEQQLGLRQTRGYLLHEAGRFAEALASNQALLADGERAFGVNDERLGQVLNNLAQNHYELGQPERSQAALLRRLAIAEKAQAHDEQAQALFQLGVLAWELGDAQVARSWFQQRLLRAQALDDDDLIEAAQDDLTDLERRVAESTPPATDPSAPTS